MVANALRNGEVIYNGHPDAVREYIHVEDVASASVNILDLEYTNCGVVLTGHQTMKVSELLEMLSEILGWNGKVQFVDQFNNGHYVRTPYSIQPDLSFKYVPDVYVDIGQGLLQLIDYTKTQLGEK